MSIYIVVRITLVVNTSCDIFADSAFLSILYELTFCTTCKRNAKIGSSLRLILKKECIFAHLTYAFLTFDQYHTCYFCHDIWIRKLICCFHPFPPSPPLFFAHTSSKNSCSVYLPIVSRDFSSLRFVSTPDNVSMKAEKASFLRQLQIVQSLAAQFRLLEDPAIVQSLIAQFDCPDLCIPYRISAYSMLWRSPCPNGYVISPMLSL